MISQTTDFRLTLFTISSRSKHSKLANNPLRLFSYLSSFILKTSLLNPFFENYPLFPLIFSKSEKKREDLKTA